MTEQTQNGDDKAARIARARELMGALGPNWQPLPSKIEWVGTATPEGQKIIVMVITDASGRKGVAFTPEALEQRLNEGLEVVGKGKRVSSPLLVAGSVPQGMPLPGKEPFRGKPGQ